jgi:hypothetical protein
MEHNGNWDDAKDYLRLESRKNRKECPDVWVVIRPKDCVIKTVLVWDGVACEVFIESLHHGISRGAGYNRKTRALTGAVLFGVAIEDNGEDFTNQLERAGLVVKKVM